jgi:hypothetical protein
VGDFVAKRTPKRPVSKTSRSLQTWEKVQSECRAALEYDELDAVFGERGKERDRQRIDYLVTQAADWLALEEKTQELKIHFTTIATALQHIRKIHQTTQFHAVPPYEFYLLSELVNDGTVDNLVHRLAQVVSYGDGATHFGAPTTLLRDYAQQDYGCPQWNLRAIALTLLAAGHKPKMNTSNQKLPTTAQIIERVINSLKYHHRKYLKELGLKIDSDGRAFVDPACIKNDETSAPPRKSRLSEVTTGVLDPKNGERLATGAAKRRMSLANGTPRSRKNQ